jgi:DNA-binding SARP family transcriptional activator/tetratricopeptide (TPR) repeat protein
MSTLGGLVADHRTRLGMTQRELATRAGLSVRALRDIENDRVHRPQASTMRRLARALGLPGPMLTAEPAPAALRVAVLGPLLVESAGEPADLASARQRDLLALLALHPGRAVPTEEIVEVLWGELPPRSHRRLVHVYIGRLRTLIEPGRDPGAPTRILCRAPGGYRLEATAAQLDLVRFDDLVARAHAAEPATARRLLAQALDCWRGPPAADAGERVRQHVTTVGLAGRRLAVALSYADLALDSGTDHAVVKRLRALSYDEPLHEGLAARLMLALAGSGEQAAALELFTGLRGRLREELGVAPGEELRAAHLRVLRQQVPTRQAVRVTGPAPAQLPADVADFSGRAEQLSQLDALLPGHASAAVISAIAGTAGVGKTALAVHWAHRVRDRFRDGQLHVDLRGYARLPPLRPAEALARLLHALGVQASQIPPDTDAAAGMYRSLLADRRMLILLDNARRSDQVRPLLPGNPNCLVLITSRDQLTGLVARDGARRITLDVLTPDESGELLTRLLGADRVRAEPEAAGELARLCAHLPLALRIAAANLADRPHETIAVHATRLKAGDRLSELDIEDDSEAAVRSAFDLSYAMLSPGDARLFRMLGHLPGPDITAEAAAALAGVPVAEAGRRLDRLRAAHLVTEHVSGRYTLHDLLRLYAAERSAGDEGARRRLFDHYLHTADAAAKVLYPQVVRLPLDGRSDRVFHDPRQAFEWLEAERDNLLAATVTAAAHGPRPHAWLLADTIRGYLSQRAFTADWLTAAEAALTAAEAEGELIAQAAARLGLATLYWRQDDYQAAIDQLHPALELARRAGWPAGQAAALGNLGVMHLQTGRLRESVARMAEATTRYRELGMPGTEAIGLTNLALGYLRLGRLRESAERYADALELFGRIGSDRGEATALGGLGEVHHRMGRFDEALDQLTRSLALLRDVGDQRNELNVQRAIAAVHRDAGRLAAARGGADTVLALARDIGERRVETDTLNLLGTIHLRLGQYREAVTHHEDALHLARDTGDNYLESEALIGLSTVHTRLDQHDHALATARAAYAIARAAGYRLLEGQALAAIADVERDPAQAATALDILTGTAAADPVRQLLHALGRESSGSG